MCHTGRYENAQPEALGNPYFALPPQSTVSNMTLLTSVDIFHDSEIRVIFTTSLDLSTACDTAVLQVVHGGGSELAVRIERGAVADVSVWDAAQLIRQRLPHDHVVLTATTVSCSIPMGILPAMALDEIESAVTANLLVNGAPVQTGVAVSLQRSSRALTSV